MARFDVLRYIADNAGLSLPEALEKAYKKGYEDAQQEPKTGHWKRISIDKYSEHAKYWYRCDKCGKDNLGDTDYCPNCGARMVEPQKSEG